MQNPVPERIKQIRSMAHDLAGKIEWFDVAQGGPDPAKVSATFADDPEFVSHVRTVLDRFFSMLPAARVPAHQERMQIAAGILMSVIKALIISILPEAAVLRSKCLRIKFHGTNVIFTQAQIGAPVPPMGEQIRRQQGGRQ